jgi:hypothetical protein
MIKNTNYILLFLLVMLYFYYTKNIKLKSIIVYTLVFTVFLKVFSEYNILKINKIENFENNIDDDEKNDNLDSKNNDTISKKGQLNSKDKVSSTSIFNYTMSKIDGYNKDKKEEPKNNNSQKKSNIQFVKNNIKKKKELSTQKLNKEIQ